jgi:rare lipoprotein A
MKLLHGHSRVFTIFSLLCTGIVVLSTSCVRRVPLETSQGMASFYGIEHHGKRTASGERYDMYDYTAAHESLPFGAKVRVINLENKRSVVVRINDRGPHRKSRIIDLSWAAAKKLKIIKQGIALVELQVLRYK